MSMDAGGEGASPTAAQGLPPPLAPRSESRIATPRDSVRAQSQNVALPGVVVWWRPGAQAQADQSMQDVYRLYLQRRIDNHNAQE